MGRLDEARELLTHAERVRSGIEADLFDVVCTRDNLGRLEEMQGDFGKAVEWRTKGEVHQMICSYFEVCSIHPLACSLVQNSRLATPMFLCPTLK